MNKYIKGYTFLELLLVTAVMGILVIMGVAAYRQFNDRQKVVQAAQDLVTSLRLAQQDLEAGIKPSGCVLDSYRLTFTSGSSDVGVCIWCNGDTSCSHALADIKIKNGIQVTSSTTTVKFRPLGAGSDETQIKLGPVGNQATLNISLGGAIGVQ
jgi:Tfp pilus assembly protein FimT